MVVKFAENGLNLLAVLHDVLLKTFCVRLRLVVLLEVYLQLNVCVGNFLDALVSHVEEDLLVETVFDRKSLAGIYLQAATQEVKQEWV